MLHVIVLMFKNSGIGEYSNNIELVTDKFAPEWMNYMYLEFYC